MKMLTHSKRTEWRKDKAASKVLERNIQDHYASSQQCSIIFFRKLPFLVVKSLPLKRRNCFFFGEVGDGMVLRKAIQHSTKRNIKNGVFLEAAVSTNLRHPGII